MQRANADRLSAIGHGSRPEKKKGKEKPKGRFDGRADELHGRGLADFVHDLVLSFLFSFFLLFFSFFFFFFFFSLISLSFVRGSARCRLMRYLVSAFLLFPRGNCRRTPRLRRLAVDERCVGVGRGGIKGSRMKPR